MSLLQELNHRYLQLHTAKEDAFWAAKMGLAGSTEGDFEAKEIRLKEYISDASHIARVRAELERDDLADDERIGLEGWLRFFQVNAIESREAKALQGKIIEMETSGDAAEAHAGSGLERLRVFLELYAAVNMSERGAFPNRLDDRELQDEVRLELRAIKRAIDRRARKLVEAGIADGSITPCDVRLTTFAFMGAIQSISRWYRPDGPQTSEEIAREFATRIISGLTPARR